LHSVRHNPFAVEIANSQRKALLTTFLGAGTALIKSIHDYRKYEARRGVSAALLKRWARLRHLLWSVFTSSDIDPNATIGARLRLPHPNGVIMHRNAVIGDDCIVHQQVTIGECSDGFAPVIGAGVYIGAGAKVLGKIVIGDRARIGANAVVLCDVPANWTAIGVPSRLIDPHMRKKSS
jgi:serine O-acetyltransferase